MKLNLIAKKSVSEMSQREKDECNLIAKYMAQNWIDKFEMAKILKINERTVRDRISTIAKKVPVISTSDSKGYKRALTKADLEAAKATSAELGSRIRELFARKKPLDEFILEIEKAVN